MELILKKSFIKQLKALPKPLQAQVREVLDKLEAATSLNAAGVEVKRMEGQKKNEHYYRIRVGEWRIGIEVIEPSVWVICILTRGDIYKTFPYAG